MFFIGSLDFCPKERGKAMDIIWSEQLFESHNIVLGVELWLPVLRTGRRGWKSPHAVCGRLGEKCKTGSREDM